MMSIALGVATLLSLGGLPSGVDSVQFQAHRGGAAEVPENTLAAYRYAWDLGAIPEVDICSTSDGAIICLHDDTLKRTTNANVDADTPVSKLTLEQIRQWDAGSWFDAKYAGEKVPTLEEVLKEMADRKKARIYLDLKNVDLDQLSSLLRKYAVAKRVIFSHNKVASCRKIRDAVPGLRTMLWIGGTVPEIKETFDKAAADQFDGLNQVQLHLKPDPDSKDRIRYLMDEDFLKRALATTKDHDIDLEVLPFSFDYESISGLLKLGIRWFATDEPKRFKSYVQRHFEEAK